MSSKRKKIRVEEVDADLDHDYVKNQIKFEASTCIDCTNYKEWLVCEVCLGPKNPVGPVVLLPPKESREEKKKRMKKYFQDRTKKKHLKKTKKEIKQGKQSTLASFLGLKKVCCHRRRRLLLFCCCRCRHLRSFRGLVCCMFFSAIVFTICPFFVCFLLLFVGAEVK